MSVYYSKEQLSQDAIAGIEYKNLVDELRLRPDSDDLVSIRDLLDLFNGEIAIDDPRIDELLARLATDGFAIAEPDEEIEAHLQKAETSIRDNVHIYMRELSKLDLLSRDEELELARARNQGMCEVLSAIATIRPVVELARTLFDTHFESGRLDRFVAGYLDVVDELPKVNVVASNAPRDTQCKQPNLDQAKVRFKTRWMGTTRKLNNDVPISRESNSNSHLGTSNLRCRTISTSCNCSEQEWHPWSLLDPSCDES